MPVMCRDDDFHDHGSFAGPQDRREPVPIPRHCRSHLGISIVTGQLRKIILIGDAFPSVALWSSLKSYLTHVENKFNPMLRFTTYYFSSRH